MEYVNVVALETGAAAVTVNVEVPPLRILVGDAVRFTVGFEEGVGLGLGVGVEVGVGVAVGVGVGVPDAEKAR